MVNSFEVFSYGIIESSLFTRGLNFMQAEPINPGGEYVDDMPEFYRHFFDVAHKNIQIGSTLVSFRAIRNLFCPNTTLPVYDLYFFVFYMIFSVLLKIYEILAQVNYLSPQVQSIVEKLTTIDGYIREFSKYVSLVCAFSFLVFGNTALGLGLLLPLVVNFIYEWGWMSQKMHAWAQLIFIGIMTLMLSIYGLTQKSLTLAALGIYVLIDQIHRALDIDMSNVRPKMNLLFILCISWDTFLTGSTLYGALFLLIFLLKVEREPAAIIF